MQIRCPHCHQPIEIIDDDPSGDMTCDSCGSGFNLANDSETIADDGSHSKSIAHFTLVDRLGQGAFGSVWKARDTELDRTVAVKIPRNDQLSSTETEQFLREARAAAQLRHPNIVPVHEIGREDGTLYIVSDLIEGLSLADWLTGQQFTFREAAELCVTIAKALDHAHTAGVIHRDLKPANIMLDGEGRPHIMDFGLARREAGEITMTIEGKLLGTPAYMPPEQARGDGHNADCRSDLYSLGVILFELLTGERPFRGNQRMLLHQVLNDEPPSPRKLNQSIPRDLETITLKCLQKEPERRFQATADLAADLQRWLDGEPVKVRRVSRPECLWRWCRREPTIALLMAGISVSLIAGTCASLVLARKATRAATSAKAHESDAVFAKNAATRAAASAKAHESDAVSAKNAALRAAGEAISEKKRALQLLNAQYLAQMIPRSHGKAVVSPNGEFVAVIKNPESSLSLLRTTADSPLDLDLSHSYGECLHVLFSPDGLALAIVSRNDQESQRLKITIHDLSSSRVLINTTLDWSTVRASCFDRQGKLFAVVDEYSGAAVFDLADEENIRHFDEHDSVPKQDKGPLPVVDVMFAQDSNRLLIQFPTLVRIWDFDSGEPSELRVQLGKGRNIAAAQLWLSGKEIRFVDQLSAFGLYSLTDGAVTELRVDDLIRQEREVWKSKGDGPYGVTYVAPAPPLLIKPRSLSLRHSPSARPTATDVFRGTRSRLTTDLGSLLGKANSRRITSQRRPTLKDRGIDVRLLPGTEMWDAVPPYSNGYEIPAARDDDRSKQERNEKGNL